MNSVNAFRVGEHYTNDQTRFSLEVENLGGIRPSVDSKKNLRHIAILTATGDSGNSSAKIPITIESREMFFSTQRKAERALGDLEITLVADNRLVTSYEMKTRRVTRDDIDRAVQKIAGVSGKIDNYIFITTKEAFLTLRQAAGSGLGAVQG